MSTRSRLPQVTARVTAALAVPLALLVTASPGHAASGQITNPARGATITSNSAFHITANLSRGLADSGEVVLSLTPPGGTAQRVDSARSSDTSLDYLFDPRCPNYGSGCAGKAAANGQYTITLTGAGVNDSAAFNLQTPPAPPSGVSASATGQRQITVTWQAGTEPDLRFYDVFERRGDGFDTVAIGLDAGARSHVVDLPSSGYGGDHTFAVRSRRCASTSCSQLLDSPMALAPAVTLSEPTASSSPQPNPDPSPGPGDPDDDDFNTGPSPSPSPGTGGTGGKDKGKGKGTGQDDNGYNTGQPAGGTASGNPTTQPQYQQRLAYGLTFKNFAPKLGAPKLPPLPKYAPAPIPQGTYNPSLPYGTRKVAETLLEQQPGAARQVIDTLVRSVFEGDRVWRSVAWSLILLIAAAHLRLWLRTSAPD